MYQARTRSLNEWESPSDRRSRRARFDLFGRLEMEASDWTMGKLKKGRGTWVLVLTVEKNSKFENNGEGGGA